MRDELPRLGTTKRERTDAERAAVSAAARKTIRIASAQTGLELVGLVDDYDENAEREVRGLRVLGTGSDLDDPKRFRPRLLLGSRYDFKSLSGLSQASRDAARDLFAYISRARWASGVAGLAKDLPKLQRVFREMVSLVATWRAEA